MRSNMNHTTDVISEVKEEQEAYWLFDPLLLF